MRARMVAVAVAVLLICHSYQASGETASTSEVGASGMGDPYFPQDGNGGYDVGRYAIHDTMRLATGELKGWTTIAATATHSLSRFNLDLLLRVDRVLVNGRPAHFSRPNRHELQVVPATPLAAGSRFTVRVDYHGRPGNLEYAGERSWFGNAEEVVAMNEPHIAAWWFAANDHPRDKARFDIHVTVPNGRRVISNGTLVGRRVGPNWTTWHWRAEEPMATYLAFFAAGHFVIERGTSASGVPYTLAVSRALDVRKQDAALALMRRTPVLLTKLEGWLGPYPFSSAGGVTTSLDTHFALENQTRPLYPYAGGAAQQWVVAHELAHQWFGDSVSVSNWRDIWLNEGLATFMELQLTGAGGWGDMQTWLTESWRSWSAGDEFWDLPIGNPGKNRLFADAVYYRGAMVVQALHHRLGTVTFKKVLQDWVQEHKYQNASVADFHALAESVSGFELDGFFQAWLYTAERPARTAANGLL